MLRATRHIAFILLILPLIARHSAAQGTLNPAGEPRYGQQTLVPGFIPDPITIDVVGGGNVDVKSLLLGYNCLGFAAPDPDFIVTIDERLERLTFLIASTADSTLVINLPNGSWSCNDDTNGMNPALVYFNAAPGAYQIWIGSYAKDTYDEAVLYLASAGPEALPTTATGPDPAREPLYGEVTLAPGFQPAPFATQIIGGGHSRVADFVDGDECRGWISEAPDFSVFVSEDMVDLWFAVRSPADMTLVVNAADGSWQCSDDHSGANPGFGFSYAISGLYDIWIGSAPERNYAASILTVTEYEPDASLAPKIDTRCPGTLATELQVGSRAVVTRPSGNPVFIAPETASTRVFNAPSGSSFTLIGGPICKDDQRWWRAELADGSRFWIADGDADSRWIEAAA